MGSTEWSSDLHMCTMQPALPPAATHTINYLTIIRSLKEGQWPHDAEMSGFSFLFCWIQIFSHSVFPFPVLLHFSPPFLQSRYVPALSFIRKDRHLREYNKIKQKQAPWNRTKQAEKKSPKKGTWNRYRCRDPIICTLRNTIKTLAWKP